MSCPGGRIEVTVITSEGSGSYASTLNLHPTYGIENAGNIGADASDFTIWHEVGHVVLGAADEYYQEHRPDGTSRPEERVNENDWSVMARHASMRRAVLHPRHFSHLPAWLERRFPDCTFHLEAAPRPIIVEISPVILTAGMVVSPEREVGVTLSTGVDFGIPLERLRQLEVTIGPRLTFMADEERISLLLGFRAGLEAQSGQAGLRAGVFGEGGVGTTFDNDSGEAGASLYAEGGGRAGYAFRNGLNLSGEFALGTLWTSDSAADPDLESNPYFRLGLTIAGDF